MDYTYIKLVLLAGFNPKLLTKQEFEDLRRMFRFLYKEKLGWKEIGNIPFQHATDTTMIKNLF